MCTEPKYCSSMCAISAELFLHLIRCIFYKLAGLTSLVDVQAHLSLEQREDFVLPTFTLSAILFASVVGALICSAVLLLGQVSSNCHTHT